MSIAKEKKITPPEVARRLGVAVEKVHYWIHVGELRATNMAKSLAGKPRFRVDVDDLAAFEQSRTVVPPAPKPKRRRRASAIKQYV